MGRDPNEYPGAPPMSRTPDAPATCEYGEPPCGVCGPCMDAEERGFPCAGYKGCDLLVDKDGDACGPCNERNDEAQRQEQGRL